MSDQDDKLPSLSQLKAATASQDARKASIEDVIEMKRQAKQIAMEIVMQAAGAAATGGLPIPESLISTIADKLVDHTVGFFSADTEGAG